MHDEAHGHFSGRAHRRGHRGPGAARQSAADVARPHVHHGVLRATKGHPLQQLRQEWTQPARQLALRLRTHGRGQNGRARQRLGQCAGNEHLSDCRRLQCYKTKVFICVVAMKCRI